MSKPEFILLIPGIVYGVALVDLLKIFRHKQTYWEVVGWGIALFFNLIVSWFGLYDKLEIISSNIVYFTVYLISPLLFAQSVFVLTPEEADTDTRKYFFANQRTFFIIYTCFMVSNAILALFIEENVIFQYMRGIAFLPFILVIFWPKKILRIFILGLYLVFAIIVFYTSLVWTTYFIGF